MRKLLLFALLLSVSLYWAGCTKCYNCQDTCMKCVLMDSIFVVNTHVICTDSFSSIAAFNSAVRADSSKGYVCTSTTSSYNQNFCINKGGKDEYMNYYNQNGTAICKAK